MGWPMAIAISVTALSICGFLAVALWAFGKYGMK